MGVKALSARSGSGCGSSERYPRNRRRRRRTRRGHVRRCARRAGARWSWASPPPVDQVGVTAQRDGHARPIWATSSEWVSRVRGFSLSRGPTTWVLSASRRSAAQCSTRALSGRTRCDAQHWSRAAPPPWVARSPPVRGRPRHIGPADSSSPRHSLPATFDPHAHRSSCSACSPSSWRPQPGGTGRHRRAAVPVARLRHRQRGRALRQADLRCAKGRRSALRRPARPAVGRLSWIRSRQGAMPWAQDTAGQRSGRRGRHPRGGHPGPVVFVPGASAAAGGSSTKVDDIRRDRSNPPCAPTTGRARRSPPPTPWARSERLAARRPASPGCRC